MSDIENVEVETTNEERGEEYQDEPESERYPTLFFSGFIVAAVLAGVAYLILHGYHPEKHTGAVTVIGQRSDSWGHSPMWEFKRDSGEVFLAEFSEPLPLDYGEKLRDLVYRDKGETERQFISAIPDRNEFPVVVVLAPNLVAGMAPGWTIRCLNIDTKTKTIQPVADCKTPATQPVK